MDDGRRDQLVRAFRRRRLAKSHSRRARATPGLLAEAGFTLVVAVAAWKMLGAGDLWTNVILPALSAGAAVLLWEQVVRSAVNYVWTVPEQEHVDAWAEIDHQAQELTAYSANVGALTAQATSLMADVERYRDLETVAAQMQRERDEARNLLEKCEAARHAFDVDVSIGGVHLLHSPKADAKPRFYVVVNEVTLTNKSETHVPVEAWLRIAVHDTWSQAFVAKHRPLPDYALHDLQLERHHQILRNINLLPRSASPVGYFAFAVELSLLRVLEATDPKAIFDHPLWLDLRNTITNRRIKHSLNWQAHAAKQRGAPVAEH